VVSFEGAQMIAKNWEQLKARFCYFSEFDLKNAKKVQKKPGQLTWGRLKGPGNYRVQT
jgi:hypothetical protein